MKRYCRRGKGKGRTKKTVVLPQELITEILLRVPVKSLLRFKSVCKSWLSLISDSHFAKSHFDLGAARTDRLALFERYVHQFLSMDVNASLYDKSAVSALKLHFLLSNPCYTQILCSCRGFLLLRLDYYRSFFMCNPCTGVYKFINHSPISEKCSLLSSFVRGFGYDSSTTDDYLLVQAFCNPQHHRLTRVEYFSLRANAWKEIEATHFPYTAYSNYGYRHDLMTSDYGLFLNGAIHWLAFRYDVSINVILAFDLRGRSFLEIPQPVNFNCRSYKCCFLRVLGDLLSLCAVKLKFSMTTEIWVMKEYKEQSSWTKTIAVCVDDFHFPTRLFFPICSTKSGDIVGRDVETVLVKCNDKGQVQEHRYYVNGLCPRQMAVYTESLLSLPCDSEQAKVDDQQ